MDAPFLTSTQLALPNGTKVTLPPLPPLRLQSPPVLVKEGDAAPSDPGTLIAAPVSAAVAERLAGVAIALVQSGLDTLTQTAERATAIRADPELSQAGREKRLFPILQRGIEELAQIWTGIDEAAARIDATEAKLLAVPPLPPNALALALVDIECREWYRAQLTEERAKVIEGLCKPDGNRDLLLALLRSPVGVADVEMKMLREKWEADARSASPDTAVGINIEREALEWARWCLAALAASMITLVGGDRIDVLKTVLRSSDKRAQAGFRVYGFDTDSAARVRRIIAAEEVVARAA